MQTALHKYQNIVYCMYGSVWKCLSLKICLKTQLNCCLDGGTKLLFDFFHIAFCSLIESMHYALLCILTVSTLHPILHPLKLRVAVKCAAAQREGSCLPLVVGTPS